MHDLYGNGQEGFLTEARDFFSRADERAKNEEKYRTKRDQEIKDTLAETNISLTRRLMIAALIISLFMAWLGFREYQRKESLLTPSPALQLPQQPQDAKNPYIAPDRSTR